MIAREIQLEQLALRLDGIKRRCQSRLSHRDERQLLFEAKRIVAELEQIPELESQPVTTLATSSSAVTNPVATKGTAHHV